MNKKSIAVKENNIQWKDGMAKNVTFIVTKDCQLACKYCYLVGKNSKERMPFEIAKQAIVPSKACWTVTSNNYILL